MKFFLTILLSCISLGAFAETGENDSITIKGIVVDENKEPLLIAVVQIFDESGKVLTGDVSDYDGNYKLMFPKPEKSKYPLTITTRHLGYKEKTHTINNEEQLTTPILFVMDETNNEEVIRCFQYIKIDVPILDPYNGGIHKTITSEEIENSPYR